MKHFFLPILALLLSTAMTSCDKPQATGADNCSTCADCKCDTCNCTEASECSIGCCKDANQVIDVILSRRSIRKYTDKAVCPELLDKILECGINAPNGLNQQAYEVKVVTDSASVAYLADNVHGLYKAPVYLFIAAGDSYDMSLIDVGLLAENIGLAAWSYGIGSICLGMPVRAIKEDPALLNKLGFGEHYNLCLAMALGYPDETPDARPRNKEKVQYITIE